RMRSRISAASGNLDAALADLVQAGGNPEDMGRLWHEMGRGLAQRGEWAAALKAFDRAAEIQPELPGLRAGRVRALGRLGQWMRAAEDYGKLATIGGSDLDTTVTYQAVSLVMADDRDAYRRLCAALLEKHGQTKETLKAFNVARIGVLTADSGIEASRLVEL